MQSWSKDLIGASRGLDRSHLFCVPSVCFYSGIKRKCIFTSQTRLLFPAWTRMQAALSFVDLKKKPQAEIQHTYKKKQLCWRLNQERSEETMSAEGTWWKVAWWIVITNNTDGATLRRKTPSLFFLDCYDGQIAAGRREDVILWHELESEERERWDLRVDSKYLIKTSLPQSVVKLPGGI